MTNVSGNLKTVCDHIAKVAQESGRDADDVRLIAVSKTQPQERVQAALDAGQRVFGENRVQEAQGRWVALKAQYPDITLHLIGPLQTNKAKDAVALFDVIQSVDRPDIARALAKEMNKQNRHLPCFVQVNTGAEAQKSGVPPHELLALLDICRAEGLHIQGLMCIPPAGEPPALHFAFLRKLGKEQGLAGLSMGMSGDYEKAIPLGATHMRLGTAIFGDRN